MEIRVHPAQQIKNNHLGSGSIAVGGIVARFAIWKNDKFRDGFSISFPVKKDANGKIYNEVYFLDKEVEAQAYATVKGQVQHLLGGGVQQPAPVQQQAPQENAFQQAQASQPASPQPAGGNIPW